MQSPEYTPFKNRLSTLMESVSLNHFRPTPFPPTILAQAPCIEFATFQDAEGGFLSNVEKFTKILAEGKPSGYLGHTYGPVVEKISGKDGTEGNAVRLLIGWQSKEKHMEFRDTELFKDNVALLREKNGGAEVVRIHNSWGALGHHRN
jgi:hypothetical protein